MTKTVIHSIGELEDFARATAADFTNGHARAIGLVGPLGVGKTAYCAAVARSLGYKQNATSPTFTLVHDYQTPRGALAHIDLYRLHPQDKETIALLQEKISDADFALVEWIDRVPALESLMDRIYKMEFNPDNSRNIIKINDSKA